ncbi:hypothetical protein GCM10017600_16290 [Streptosporangium carneum]|uniref:Uncharacterized protein n=1 Tax=Streptosporangium carneum TaxID=47481 RepID=A0A9W6HZG7_9ACTN|nr:hypothetical protein GCM10017600_16290 [Streptosporangium carneum]
MIACDIRVFERPHECATYLKIRAAVFLLPGESKIKERKELILRDLSAMCSESGRLRSGVWRLTSHELDLYEASAAARKRAQRPRSIGCDLSGGLIDMFVEGAQVLDG